MRNSTVCDDEDASLAHLSLFESILSLSYQHTQKHLYTPGKAIEPLTFPHLVFNLQLHTTPFDPPPHL